MNIRVQVDGQLYEVEIGDLSSRPIQAVVDGELFAVWPAEETSPAATASPPASQPSENRPRPTSWPAPANNQAEIVAAPLPGDILSVAVKTAERVEVGQLLCVIESMKMNNSVRSQTAGVVEEIMVTVGDHVNFGQPMMRLRPSTPAKE